MLMLIIRQSQQLNSLHDLSYMVITELFYTIVHKSLNTGLFSQKVVQLFSYGLEGTQS
jgi:hypothetical protein